MASKGFFSAFDDVWMLDGVRTPMVDYCGALGHISPTDLGINGIIDQCAAIGLCQFYFCMALNRSGNSSVTFQQECVAVRRIEVSQYY